MTEHPPSSPDANRTAEADDRLDGWKEIGAYLDRDVRTLRRWEKNEGLPIHRLMHDKLASVYAFRSELDAWRDNRGTKPAKAATTVTAKTEEHPSTSSRPRNVLAIVGGAIAILIAYALWPDPATDFAFQPSDWVLISSFENRTGEAVFDGTLEFALERELSNSGYVKVVPQERIDDTLELMRLPSTTQIDARVGRELCLRDGDIRVLLTGRVENLGGTYLLSTAIVSPVDGVTQVSVSAEARDQSEILEGVRSLSSQVREALGEELASIQASQAQLARVTTPSLDALKLYTQAEQMLKTFQRNKALPLLEQAVAKDPEFAAAHHLMWFVLSDSGETTRAKGALDEAVRLSEKTTDRERLFIRATYETASPGQDPQAINTLETLSRLDPTHYWAASNLFFLYTKIGSTQKALEKQLLRADLRPRFLSPQIDAAIAATLLGQPDRAQIYLGRVQESLADDEPLPATLTLLPIHSLWHGGQLEEARSALDRLVSQTAKADLLENRSLYNMVRSSYLALGQLDRFRELSAWTEQPDELQAIVAIGSGDYQEHIETLRSVPPTFRSSVLLSRFGRVKEARAVLEDPSSAERVYAPFLIAPWENLAKGELALAQGDQALAITHLSEAVPWLRSFPTAFYQLGLQSLAKALDETGQTEEAITWLKKMERSRELSISWSGATHVWFRNQAYLALLYEKVGDETSSRRVRAEIESLLRLADAGYSVF